jgi:RNA polymerase sigma factor (sigma-70 family)
LITERRITMNDASSSRTGQEPDEASCRGDRFPLTRWSLVLRVGDTGDPATAAAALAELCRMYWRPVYSFLRHRGNTSHDAEDLTQGFFAMLLDRGSLGTAEEAKGRLRSFLLVALKRFVAGQYRHQHALIRGGGAAHLPIDTNDAEDYYAAEPATNVTPDLLFERQWALTLLDVALAKLRGEYARAGRERVFEALEHRLSDDGDPASFASLAAQLGMNEGAVRVALHRLRQRYKKMLREEIETTVESPGEVDGEIQHLFRVFRAPG